MQAKTRRAPAKGKTKVEECASLLGKRGAEARKRKKAERLTEAEKQRAISDALAIAML